jgi:hypothetical protein
MEAFVLENKETIERMAAGKYAGKVPSHAWRDEFERICKKHSPTQVITWTCNCDSVKRAAKVIVAHEN